MATRCPACGNENTDDALYCAVCQHVFRKEKGPASEAGLGDLLAQKQASQLGRIARALAAGALASLPLMVLDAVHVLPPGWVLGGGILAFAAVAMLVSYAPTLSLFERGAELHGPLGVATLRYDQVRSFSWDVARWRTRRRFNMVRYRIGFEPLPGGAAEAIRFSLSEVWEGDEGLDGVRDRISGVVAARLAAELERSGAVEWTPGLRLGQDALVHTPSGLFGQGTPFRLGLDLVERWSIEDGTFKVWSRGGGGPVIEERSGAPNFYPGLRLFVGLLPRR